MTDYLTKITKGTISMINFKKQILLTLVLGLFVPNSTIQTQKTQKAQTTIETTKHCDFYTRILNDFILNKVNISNPSEKEQTLINTCRAFNEFGTEYPMPAEETLQALTSIEIQDILKKYDHTVTASGYIALTEKSTQLTDNLEKLQQKQANLIFLSQRPEDSEKLTKILISSTPGEKTFFNLFKLETDQEVKNKHKLDENKIYFDETGAFSKWNESKSALETCMRSRLLLPTLAILNAMLAPVAADVINQKLQEVNNSIPDQNQSSLCTKIGKALWTTTKELPTLPFTYKSKITPIYGETGATIMTALILGSTAINIYTSGKSIHETFKLTQNKQKELISVAQLFRAMQSTYLLIHQQPELQTVFAEEYKQLDALFNPKNTASDQEVKYLISELLSSSFIGKSSCFFAKQGKILATHHMLNRLKGKFIPFIEAFGNIDATLSIVKLYQEFKDNPHATFCLPTFISSEQPILHVDEFWHPLLNPAAVVTNTLYMGNDKLSNLIITGPNAGGKTTSIMALIINIIFAQAFGIAPSKRLSLTPFAKVHSYVDITTNLQKGLSLFAAEVDRAEKLNKSILSCKPGQKTFTIIDEIFSGTAPNEAADAGFKFASLLGKISHSMTIITTHIPRLTDLATETNRFENFKVADAIIAADGKITYPFKLVQGKSTQNIAAQMLQNAGLI